MVVDIDEVCDDGEGVGGGASEVERGEACGGEGGEGGGGRGGGWVEGQCGGGRRSERARGIFEDAFYEEEVIVDDGTAETGGSVDHCITEGVSESEEEELLMSGVLGKSLDGYME